MQISGLNISGGLQLWPNDPYFPDPYFEYTTLLLPGNGTNNGTNNTFIDGSTNNFTITRNGNTTQGTFSPFSQTGWSNYFDGSGDYLRIARNSAFDFSNQDFTIECWVYAGAFITGTPIFGQQQSSATSRNSWALRISSSGAPEFFCSAGTNIDVSLTSSENISLNTWNHIAGVRNGNIFTLYVNGVNRGSTTSSITINYDSTYGDVLLGASRNGATYDRYYTGYIASARAVKGTAVYTSDFTPPTAPLTAIANTSLLTCQSNRFIDNSTNNFALTVNGNTSVQSYSPFNPTILYSPSTVGGSGYFDGSGDYLSLNGGAPLAFGTSDFTIEFWYFSNNSGLKQFLYDARPASSDGNYITIFKSASNVLELYVQGDSKITGSTVIKSNSWNHVALCRSGSSTKIFLNGQQEGSTYSDSNNYLNGSNRPVIGVGGFTLGNLPLNGYLSDMRVLNGTALYTEAFTPPTSPLTAITNTQLLLNFTNGQITDATSKNILETVADAKISTAQSKWGGSSMYFDGTGDYLRISDPTVFAFGTGDFTIEFWIRFNSLPTTTVLFDGRNGSSTGVVPVMSYSASALRYFTGSSDKIIGGSLSTNTWYHIAVARSGTNTKLFLDGNQTGSTYTDTNNYVAVSRPYPVIAARYDGTSPLNGYINDFRSTKGYARYTTNFTPPTQAFPLF